MSDLPYDKKHQLDTDDPKKTSKGLLFSNKKGYQNGQKGQNGQHFKSKSSKLLIIILICIIVTVLIIAVVLAGVLGARRAQINHKLSIYNGLYGLEYFDQIEDILGKMSQEEKIGQMLQPNKGKMKNVVGDIQKYKLGSMLSAGGEGPEYPKQKFVKNTAADWYNMTSTYLEAYKNNGQSIPLIYAVDAVHGHDSITGATVFPHNIGMGCTNDTDLLTRQGRVTSQELRATGILWNFSPFVSVPDDVRWGRTYEGYSQNVNQNANLGVAYLKGAQSNVNDSYQHPIAMCTSKHYIADGQWVWGYGVDPSNVTLGLGGQRLTTTDDQFIIDEGQFDMSDDSVKSFPGVSHKAMVDNGVMSVMIGYGRSQTDNLSTIINPNLVKQMLRQEFGFKGVIISDFEAVARVYPVMDYKESVYQAFQAGVGLFMVGDSLPNTSQVLTDLINTGRISMDDVDTNVRHMLEIKLHLGLYEEPIPSNYNTSQVFSAENQAVATEAVEKSLVLLQNNNNVLPLDPKSVKSVGVLGWAGNNMGAICGGWTLTWQGGNWTDTQVPGVNIFNGIETLLNNNPKPTFYNDSTFVKGTAKQDVGIYVLPESPLPTYAEGVGDQSNPTLSPSGVKDLVKARDMFTKLIVIIISGRPVEIDPLVLNNADAIVAAWLPGNLGGRGIANVLFGGSQFSGKLGFAWPISFDNYGAQTSLDASPSNLYNYGYGLTY